MTSAGPCGHIRSMVTEERVSTLEATLARFIDQTNLIIAAIHEDIAEIRASNARTDRRLLELQQEAHEDRQRADEDRQRADEDRKRTDERQKQWEEELTRDRQRADEDRKRTDERQKQWEEELTRDRQRADEDRKRWEEELRRYDERMEQDQKRWEQERKDFNKRLAEISDSMGMLIEDMVAPCGFQLAKSIFGAEEAETSTIRFKRKHPAYTGEIIEVDLLAIGPTKVLAVEAKRKMDATLAREYLEKLGRLAEFVPELAGKTVYPAVASVYLDPSVVRFLNRAKIYGIAMGDEVMEVVNLGQF